MAGRAAKPATATAETEPAEPRLKTLYAAFELSDAQRKALQSLVDGDPGDALTEAMRGNFELLFLVQNRLTDPEQLASLGGRGRTVLLPVVQTCAVQLAAAAQGEAGPQEEPDDPEGAALGPVDPDEGEAA